MAAGDLVFVDTETTGLDPTLHQAYEVAWALSDGEVRRLPLPHTLENADPEALAVGGYVERGFTPEYYCSPEQVNQLIDDLTGATLVGSNPAFDAAFLRRVLGHAPWHYRLVDVAQGAMWLFGWERPRGLADVTRELSELGYVIPEPDHTAAGDVMATRAVYSALRDIGAGRRVA